MERRDGPGRFAAAAALSAILTAGRPWLAAALGWGLAAILTALPRPRWEKKCVRFRKILGAALTAGLLFCAEQAFPEDSTFPFVSAGMLALLLRAMRGEERTCGDVARLLGLILLPLLAVILLFGLGEVRWAETVPREISWQDLLWTLAAAAPWWLPGRPLDRRDWRWMGASAGVAVGLSVLTAGVLGTALARQPAPLYHAVQTVRILGALQRLEALASGLILLGCFAGLLQVSALFDAGQKSLKKPKKDA